MLTVNVPAWETYNEETEEIEQHKAFELTLEHSLVSVSKWEAKWHKPFLSEDPKTPEETLDYIRCMTITQHVDEMCYQVLGNKNLKKISDYINDSQTATWFSKRETHGRKQVITSEVIYYWMVSYQIPFDPCQKWHLNRLLTLIEVCDRKSGPQKKMSKSDIYSRNRSLNAARKKALGTSG